VPISQAYVYAFDLIYSRVICSQNTNISQVLLKFEHKLHLCGTSLPLFPCLVDNRSQLGFDDLTSCIAYCGFG
jgi:hypothetical protein